MPILRWHYPQVRQLTLQAVRSKLHGAANEVQGAGRKNELRNQQTCRAMARGPSPCDPFHLRTKGRVMDVEEEGTRAGEKGPRSEGQRSLQTLAQVSKAVSAGSTSTGPRLCANYRCYARIQFSSLWAFLLSTPLTAQLGLLLSTVISASACC